MFDRKHKSHLFLDEAMLGEVKSGKDISREMSRRAEEQGQSFTRFNSVTLECRKRGSHLYVPIEVSGPNGDVKCLALFDTGATTTMLSGELISATGRDDLRSVPREEFSTANGVISCPIVSREIVISGLRRAMDIAVIEGGGENLLGMNFFEGMGHIVDFPESAIYVWVE